MEVGLRGSVEACARARPMDTWILVQPRPAASYTLLGVGTLLVLLPDGRATAGSSSREPHLLAIVLPFDRSGCRATGSSFGSPYFALLSPASGFSDLQTLY